MIKYSVENRTEITVQITNRETEEVVTATITTEEDIINISGLAAGNYTIVIENTLNENFTASGDEANFTVDKYTPVISVESGDVTYGENICVKVTSDVSGKYTVKVGEKSQSVELVKDEAMEINFTDLAASEEAYLINVTYVGNENYTGALNDTEKVKVSRAKSSVVITVTDGVFNTTNATVTYTIENSTSVSFNITKDGFEVIGDISKLNETLAGLGAGTYNIEINNALSENFTASSDSDTFTVTPAGSVVDITVVANGVFNTTNVTVDIELVNTTVVKFNITSGDLEIAGSIDKLNDTLAMLGAGNYNITVSNVASENFTAFSDSASFVVEKAKSSINIDPIVNVTYGSPVTVSFTAENATRVTYTVNGSDIAEAEGNEIILSDLASGNYIITITNAGNDNITGTSETAEFSVNRASSSVVLEDIANVTYNTPVDVKFSVVNETSVSWTIVDEDNNVVQSGTANITGLLLAAGKYSINVTNVDTDNITGSSDVYNFTVFKADSKINVSDFNNVTYGSDLIINFYC